MTDPSLLPPSRPVRRGPISIFAGPTYPFRALALFYKTPKLRGYILLPIVLNVLLGGALYTGALYLGWQGIEQILGNLPTWAVPLEFLLRGLLIILLLFVTGFIFLQFGVLLGSPWYGKLSEEIEKLQTGRLVLVEINPVAEISRAVNYELKKLVLWVSVGLLLLLANFLPGFGTLIATVGGFSLAATIACMDFLDPALERRRLRFRQKLGMVRRGLPASFTFGLVCFGLSSIPFLNLLSIPVCVAAGTLFFCDRLSSEP